MVDAPEAPAVLVVEDEALIRMAIADSLEEIGVTPYEAGDASEALDVLGSHPEIKILFTDVNMPGEMDGLGLAKRVCEVRPDVSIIVTSGRRQIPECELPGESTFLPKPYRPHQLIAAVQQKLRRLAERLQGGASRGRAPGPPEAALFRR